MEQMKSLEKVFFMTEQERDAQTTKARLHSSADIFTFAFIGKMIIFHNLNTERNKQHFQTCNYKSFLIMNAGSHIILMHNH